MAGSDTNVEVRITGQVDPSLNAATDAAKASVQSLGTQGAVNAQQMAQALQATGNDLSKVTPEMLGLGAATEAVAASTAASSSAMTAGKAAMDGIAVSTSRLSRETVVLTRELVAGNYSRLPGSLIVVGEAFSGLSLSMLAAAGAAAAVAAGIGYAVYEALAAEKALDQLAEAFALTGREGQFSRDNIADLQNLLGGLPGVSSAAAASFLQITATSAQVNNVLANQVGQLLPAFIDAYGDKGPNAAGKLLNALSSLTLDGFRKLDTELLNLSPTQYETISSLIRTGDTAKAVSAILEQLSRQSGVYIKSIGDQVYDTEQKIRALKDLLSSGNLTDLSAIAVFSKQLEDLEARLGRLQKLQEGQSQAGANTRYKNALIDADKLNESLDEQGRLLAQIGRYQDHLNEARAKGDAAGVATFTQAIANEREKLNTIETQANEKSFRDFVAKEDAKAASFKQGSAQRIAILQGEVNEAARLFGTESTQYQQVLSRLNSAKRASADEQIREDQRANNEFIQDMERTASEIDRIRRQDLNADLTISQMQLEAKKEELDQEVASHRITADQKYAILAELIREEAALNIERLQNEMQSGNLSVAQYDADAQKIRQIQQRLNLDLARLNRQAATENQRLWNQATRTIENSFNSSLNGMILGTESWQQGVQGIITGVVGAFLNMGEKIAEDWLETQIANLFVTEATSTTSSLAQITAAAAVAAANAYASTAAIPIIGPELAPAAAALAFEGTMAWAAAAAFDVGTGFVPKDMMANIHAGEIIVPRTFSDDIRAGNLTLGNGSSSNDAGGGRGDVHLHIGTVMDGPSLGAWFNKNRGLIQRAVRTA